ncbi:MAG TPA: tRNA epoxyqueuosine(34) reductase QueG [Planctomycetes bacterium]|nr:tRNA epoxyqueuosine(34) reductase QueG [Planctomycetota bacterium]
MIRELAKEVGLDLKAIISAQPLDSDIIRNLDDWLEEGRAGEMGWLERGRPSMADLRDWKPWVKSAALFSLPFHRPAGGFRGGGRVARYALGKDYHHVLGRKLEKIGKRLRAEGRVGAFRGVVDAAPVLEKEWALRGQLGFRGKNTLVLDPQNGPWTFLGELLLDTEWEEALPREFPEKKSCAGCTKCLNACPTDALDKAWSLEPRKCISYWTIEAKGPIPRTLRHSFKDWVFGCDICSEACPFGTGAGNFEEEWGTHFALEALTLQDLLTISPDSFARTFTGSPIRRAGPEGMARNATIALGNMQQGGNALKRALTTHHSPLIRGHAAWALGELGEKRALEEAKSQENDPFPLEEITTAIVAASR